MFSAEDLETLELGLQALTKAKKLEAGHADLVRFLALSGLRRGEALGLRWKDINLDQGWMAFEEHKADRDPVIQLWIYGMPPPGIRFLPQSVCQTCAVEV